MNDYIDLKYRVLRILEDTIKELDELLAKPESISPETKQIMEDAKAKYEKRVKEIKEELNLNFTQEQLSNPEPESILQEIKEELNMNLTQEQHEVLLDHALDYFTQDRKGEREQPMRFLYKAMVKGYTEEINGEKYTIKLTLKWFRNEMGEAEWRKLKRSFGLGCLIGLGGAGVTSYVYNVFHIHSDKWSPETELLANELFSVVMGYIYTRAMLKMTTEALKYEWAAGGDKNDSGISEAG